MKYIGVILLLPILSGICFSENKIDVELLVRKKTNYYDKENRDDPASLTSYSHAGVDLGPSDIYINTFTGGIWIYDGTSFNLKIFNPEMKFLKSMLIDNSDVVDSLASRVIKFPDGNYAFFGYGTIFITDGEFNAISKFSEELQIKSWNFYQRYWVYDKYLFTYADNEIKIIESRGTLLSDEDRKNIIDSWRGKALESLEAPVNVKKDIEEFLIENNLVYIDNCLYALKYEHFLEYYQYFGKTSLENYHYTYRESHNIRHLLGFDINRNIYLLLWPNDDRDLKIICLDPEGNLKMEFDFYKFKPESEVCTYNFEISPNGDIYWYNSDKESFEFVFYRAKNTWGPEPGRLWEEYLKKNVITNLTTTSTLRESPDENAYTPEKLFDGNPETMWNEGTEGPGIGESVTVSFNKKISVDKISFQPGCFIEKYWKRNYRVKQLTIEVNGEKHMASFSDEMKDQIFTFPKPLTFSTIKIIISAIYPTEE